MRMRVGRSITQAPPPGSGPWQVFEGFLPEGGEHGPGERHSARNRIAEREQQPVGGRCGESAGTGWRAGSGRRCGRRRAGPCAA